MLGHMKEHMLVFRVVNQGAYNDPVICFYFLRLPRFYIFPGLNLWSILFIDLYGEIRNAAHGRLVAYGNNDLPLVQNQR